MATWSPDGSGNVYVIPDYVDAADLPAQLKSYSAMLDNYITPIGAILPFAGTGSTPPSAWLFCDGGEYPSEKYPQLEKLLGQTYGKATKDKYFVVPNLVGRFPIGMNAADTRLAAVGKTGGKADVTLDVPSLAKHAHTGGEHTHTTKSLDISVTVADQIVKRSHKHSTGYRTAPRASTTGTTNVPIADGTNTDETGSVELDVTHKHTATGSGVLSLNPAQGDTGETGESKPLEVLNPFLVIRFIIRAG